MHTDRVINAYNQLGTAHLQALLHEESDFYVETELFAAYLHFTQTSTCFTW